MFLGVGGELRVETREVKRNSDQRTQLIAELETDGNSRRKSHTESDICICDVGAKRQGIESRTLDAGEGCVGEVSELDFDAGSVWDLSFR